MKVFKNQTEDKMLAILLLKKPNLLCCPGFAVFLNFM